MPSETETLRPNAAGDYTNITYQEPGTGSHWDKVDEVTPDGSSTICYATTATELKDAYALTASAIPAGSTINSVKVYWNWRPSWTECYSKPYLRLGANETAGTQINPNSGDRLTSSETLGRPGGGSWTVSDLDSLQVCIGVWASSADYYSQLTQVYVEVDYTLPAAGAKDTKVILALDLI